MMPPCPICPHESSLWRCTRPTQVKLCCTHEAAYLYHYTEPDCGGKTRKSLTFASCCACCAELLTGQHIWCTAGCLSATPAEPAARGFRLALGGCSEPDVADWPAQQPGKTARKGGLSCSKTLHFFYKTPPFLAVAEPTAWPLALGKLKVVCGTAARSADGCPALVDTRRPAVSCPAGIDSVGSRTTEELIQPRLIYPT